MPIKEPINIMDNKKPPKLSSQAMKYIIGVMKQIIIIITKTQTIVFQIIIYPLL